MSVGDKVELLQPVSGKAFFVGKNGTVDVQLSKGATGVVSTEGDPLFARFEHPTHGPVLISLSRQQYQLST